MKRSRFLKLNARDLVQGAIGAFVGSVLTALVQFQQGVPFDLRSTLIGGAVAALSFLLRQWVSNSEGTQFKREKKAGVPKMPNHPPMPTNFNR